jgi:hypothetical protein
VIEQRRSRRFEIRLPVKIVRSGLSSFSGSGETRNMCSRGVLFICDAPVEIGGSIEYVIALPAGLRAPWPINLRCLGKILRFESTRLDPEGPDRPFCMAASIERYEFVRVEPQAGPVMPQSPEDIGPLVG